MYDKKTTIAIMNDEVKSQVLDTAPGSRKLFD